jgi:hypothetical protein
MIPKYCEVGKIVTWVKLVIVLYSQKKKKTITILHIHKRRIRENFADFIRFLT